MKAINKFFSSLILLLPLASCNANDYGPQPINCHNDNDCQEYPDGKCDIINEEGAYCLFPCFEAPLTCKSCKDNSECQKIYDDKEAECVDYKDKTGTNYKFCKIHNFEVEDGDSELR